LPELSESRNDKKVADGKFVKVSVNEKSKSFTKSSKEISGKVPF